MKLVIACALLVASVLAEPPVDNRYLPPSQTYGAPGSGFGARGQSGFRRPAPSRFTSVRPSSLYGAPRAAPSTQYGAPSAPSTQYGAPNAPSTQYGAPNGLSTQFGAPNAPSTQFGAPNAPTTQYGTPNAPSTQYGAPNALSARFGAPNAPSTQYGAPNAFSAQFGSNAPSALYGAPEALSAKYAAPQNAPSSLYGAPRNGFGSQFDNARSQLKGADFSDAQSRQYLPPGAGRAGYTDESNSEPANYNFEYMVKDEYSGNDFGHREARVGDRAEGLYYVVLPDGRKQTVEYEADQDGYKPRISYEDTGLAAYRNGQGYVNGGYNQEGPY